MTMTNTLKVLYENSLDIHTKAYLKLIQSECNKLVESSNRWSYSTSDATCLHSSEYQKVVDNSSEADHYVFCISRSLKKGYN